MLTVGLFGSRGRRALRGAGANDACLREAQQPLGDCPQPHFSRAIGPAGESLGYATRGATSAQQTIVTPPRRLPSPLRSILQKPVFFHPSYRHNPALPS